MLAVSALASPQWQAGYYEALQQAGQAEQRGREAAAQAGGGTTLPYGFVAPIPGSGACQWSCPGGDGAYYVPCAQTQLCGGQCDPRICANSKQDGVDCAYLQSQLPAENCG
ncbi:MAG: hypothetical protein Q9214_003609 [Letrouitia sp. 1 TL-2023]